MDVVIRKAELQDLDLLMRWRMEVLHEVFSIPADQPLAPVMMLGFAILPVIIVYLCLSKFIVRGVTLGGVKG